MSKAAANHQGKALAGKVGAQAMLLSPVVERELRVALHRRDVRKARSTVARVGVILVSLFMLLSSWMGTASGGRTVHFFLLLAGLCLAVGPAFQISVGLFAEERRQQTLELLYLTGMGSGELFIGKLLGGALVSSSEVLALAPLMAVPFLSGGLSFEVFVATLVCLPTVFVLVLAIGALGSAMCKQEGTALVVSGVLVGAICLALPLPYNLGLWLTGAAPFDKSWLVLSPALGPWMAAKNLGGFRMGDFWVWAALTWAWAGLCLAVAPVILRYNWRRDLERAGAEGGPAKWGTFVLGQAGWREALRRRVLAVNAYQWLAQQDRRPVLQAWGFIASVCAFWLLGWCAWPRIWPSALNFYTTAIILLAGVDWLASYAAARRMAVDRRDGGLELLLTTALRPEEMLSGQQAALAEQFRPVKRALSGLLALMVGGGLLTRTWTTQGLVSYFAVWSMFFVWCWRPAGRSTPLSMWVAANCGRSTYLPFRSRGKSDRVWSIYWVAMLGGNLGAFGGGVRSFPRGTTAEMAMTGAVIFWVLLAMFANRQSSKQMVKPFCSQLRLIAQEPVPERNDPRFKKWQDIRTRFPAPSRGRAGYPGEDLSPEKPVRASGVWLWRPLGRVCGRAWGRLRKAARQGNRRRR